MGIASQKGVAQGCARRPAWKGTGSDPAAAPHPQPGELPRGHCHTSMVRARIPIALAIALRAFHPQHRQGAAFLVKLF